MPPYLLTINLTMAWYIPPSGRGSLSVCMSCLLSVATYLESSENASIPNVSRNSWVRMLGSLWGCYILNS